MGFQAWEKTESGPSAPAWTRWCTPARVFGVALGFYLANAAWFAYPNEFGAMLASLQGLDPFRSIANPVWQTALLIVSALPGMRMSVAASLVSAVCGAAAVALVFLVAHRARFRWSKSRARQALRDEESAASRALAGLVAAGYAVASLPIYVVSTRPHPGALSALLFMLAVALTQSFAQDRRGSHWFAFCFVYGLGCAELPTFLLAAPVFAPAWVWLLLRANMLRAARVGMGFLVFLAGCSVVFAWCWRYYQSPVAEWRQFPHVGTVLREFALMQAHALANVAPRVGWIPVLFLTIAPAAVFLRSQLDDSQDLFSRMGLAVFRLVLAAVALYILADAPGTPWRLTGPANVMVTPYLVVALWFSRVVAVTDWQLAQLAPSRRRKRVSPWKRYGRPALAGVVVLSLVVGAARHVEMAHPARARPVLSFADAVLDSLGGREWLLTDGSLDALLALRAHERGLAFTPVNRTLARSRAYLLWVRSRLPDAERRSVAGAGLKPLLDVWFEGRNAAEEIASFDYPDLWLMQGWGYRPSGVVFIGVARDAPLDPDALCAQTMRRLAPFAADFGAAADPPPVEARYYRRISRHLGMIANNLGVLLEDAGAAALAWEAYRGAVAFDASNLSALYNLDAMAQREGRSEAAAIRAQRDRARAAAVGRQAVPEYGFVRNASAYAQQGRAWAAGGWRESATERMRDAAALAPTNETLRILLAEALRDSHADDESVEVFAEAIARDPGNARALAGLARIHLSRGEYADAAALLERASAGSEADFVVERAAALAGLGRADEAFARLERAARSERSRPATWLAMGLLARDRGDRDRLQEAAFELGRAANFAPGLVFLADLALGRGDTDEARQHLRRATELDPRHVGALDRLARLEFAASAFARAEEAATTLLNLDPENATANYVIGMAHLRQGAADLAEASLRRSLRNRVTSAACHALAVILWERGEVDEALGHARLAVSLAPRRAVYWANLGRILEAKNDAGAAAACYARAREIQSP